LPIIEKAMRKSWLITGFSDVVSVKKTAIKREKTLNFRFFNKKE
jgi:hypothetical protein